MPTILPYHQEGCHAPGEGPGQKKAGEIRPDRRAKIEKAPADERWSHHHHSQRSVRRCRLEDVVSRRGLIVRTAGSAWTSSVSPQLDCQWGHFTKGVEGGVARWEDPIRCQEATPEERGGGADTFR